MTEAQPYPQAANSVFGGKDTHTNTEKRRGTGSGGEGRGEGREGNPWRHTLGGWGGIKECSGFEMLERQYFYFVLDTYTHIYEHIVERAICMYM